jgi:hypothetical protein
VGPGGAEVDAARLSADFTGEATTNETTLGEDDKRAAPGADTADFAEDGRT